MSTFTNKLLGLDVTTGSPLTVTTGDTVSTGGNWTFTENVVISQDLTVNGTTTTINTQDVLIADRFVVQSYNYQSPAATPQTAGNVYVVEADPDSLGTFTIDNTKNASLVTAGSVTAGDSGFTTTADPTALVAGDIISVTGLTVDPENNGLYEVKGTSTAPNQIAIKTVPESSVDGIVNNAIAGAATQADSGTTVQTHIMVIRANTDGTTMSIGYGQQTALTFATIGVAGSATLQKAYDGTNPADPDGNTITTANSKPIAFTLTSGDFTVQGAGAVAFGNSTEVGSFSAFSSGVMTLQSRDTTTLDMQANDAGAKTLTISASNAGAGAANVAVTAEGAVTVNAGDETAAGGNPVVINAGDGGGANNGGVVNIIGGEGGAGATGDGGNVNLTGGSANSTNGGGGSVVVNTGDGTGTGVAGALEVTGPNTESEAIVTLETTGTSGDKVGLYVGDNSPNGSVSAEPGSLFLRDTGLAAPNLGGELWVNVTNGGVPGTSWELVQTGGGDTSLQVAYDNGQSITTTAADGPITFVFDTNAAGFTMDGDASGVGDVTMGATTPINTFTADTTGPISLESTGTASNFTLTANDGGNALLTIKSSNGGAGQGNILIEADDTLTMQTLSSTINIGTNAVAQNITVGNQTGTSRVDIDTGSGGFHIDANDNATVSADSTINVAGDLTTTLDETQAADSGNPGNAYTVTTGDGATAGVTNPGGTGGNLHLFGGSGGDAQLAANAGGAGAEIHLLSGTGGAGATALAAGTGGLLKLEAGDAGAPNGGPGGTGGAVDIDAGAGVTGGNVTIDAGAGTTTDGSITIGATVGSTNAVVIGNSTDHGITMSMSQSNNQFDIERFLTTATGAALAITYDAAAFTGTPHGIEVALSDATSITNGGDVYGINLTGQTNAGAGVTIGSGFDSGWDYAFKSGSRGWFLDNRELLFGTSGGGGFQDFQIKFNAIGKSGLQIGDFTGGADTGLIGNAIDLFCQNGGDAGSTFAAGAGGDMGFLTGDGGAAGTAGGETSAKGGDLTIDTGNGGNGAAATNFNGGTGGGMTVTLGRGGLDTAAGGVGGTGGAFTVTAGQGGSGLTVGDGGAINLTGGESGQAAAAATTPGTGGAVNITGGLGNTPGGSDGGIGGAVNIASGAGGDCTNPSKDGGNAGAVSITGGTGGNCDGLPTEVTGDGGAISITAGTGGVSANASSTHADAGTGGNMSLTAGTGGAATAAGGEAGHGGNVTLTGGAGGSAINAADNGDGGSVTIDAGSGAAAGSISIGGTNTTAIDLSTGTTEASAVIDLINTTHDVSVYVGTSDPSAGAGFAANEGSLFLRDNGGTGEAWLKTGAADTAWSLLGTAAGSTLTQAYVNGPTLTTNSTQGDVVFAGTENFDLNIFLDTGSNVGQGSIRTTGAAVAAGDVLRMTAGAATVQGADGGTTVQNSRVMGIALEAAGAAAPIKVHTTYGVEVNIAFTGIAPVVSDIGAMAYLSTATGKATKAIPTGSGEKVVELGIIMGAGATAPVLYAPRFVAAIA